MPRWMEWLVMLLSSPFALEVIRRLGERLNKPDVPPISQLAPAERERLVREAAADAIVAVVKVGDPREVETVAARPQQRGRA